MPAIPIVVFDAGFSDLQKGTLFNPPSELFSFTQMAVYASCKVGWSRCPLGYGVYAAYDALGRKIVVPGIYLKNEVAPKRRFPEYPLKFTRNEVELFAASHLEVAQQVKEKRDVELKSLTHDLRAISNEIYHNSLAVKSHNDVATSSSLIEQIDTVLAAQQMMSVRLDIIDYESGLASERPKEPVSPFPKTEKVIRCFDNKIRNRGLRRRIEGKSFSKTFGPPIFEIVPFVIVENAIKYAPSGTTIVVKFDENDDEIIIRFESLGPEITEREMSKIFERSYRGSAVRDSQRTGSGIGLFAAKTIVENHFGGKIFVNQFDASLLIDGNTFWDTRFTVIVPVVREDMALKPKIRRS